jgi:DNA-binding response OmpR family regulator
MRRMLALALAEVGYEVVETQDGEAAWRGLQALDAPRLAILDWVMPGLDGVEICRLLRRTPVKDPPYVILLTGRNSKEDVGAGLQAGAHDYITKPFDRAELQAWVQVGRRVLERNRVWRAGSATWKPPCGRSSTCAACCPAVATARRCATTTTPGSRSIST